MESSLPEFMNAWGTKDVARMFTEESAFMQGKDPKTVEPLSVEYIKRMVRDSKPNDGTNKRPRRYAANPIRKPELVDNMLLLWRPREGETLDDVERELRAWYRSVYKGKGAGGGKPRKDGTPAGSTRIKLEEN